MHLPCSATPIHFLKKAARSTSPHIAPYFVRDFARWARSMVGNFPPDIEHDQLYWNTKLPVACDRVEGRFAKRRTQRALAQIQIEICDEWIRAKPTYAVSWRVTCLICLPDFWTSELCIYVSDDYWHGHDPNLGEVIDPVCPAPVTAIAKRSLAAEWRLTVPESMQERGVSIQIPETNAHGGYTSEHWRYGEVGRR